MADVSKLQSLKTVQPSLSLPYIDFQVGYRGRLETLKDPKSLPSEGADIIYRDRRGEPLKLIEIRKDGAVFDGYDLRGTFVIVTANDVTIRNCVGDATSWYTIDQYEGFSGLTVEHCTFDAGGVAAKLAAFVASRDGAMTVRRNVFLKAPADVIHVFGGLVEENYISGGGFCKDAHADAIWISRTPSPTIVRGNFIDWTMQPGAAVLPNNAVRIAQEKGPITSVLVENNVLLGGSYTVSADGVGNIIRNNVIGEGKWGALYPSLPPDLVYDNNIAPETGRIWQPGNELLPPRSKEPGRRSDAGKDIPLGYLEHGVFVLGLPDRAGTKQVVVANSVTGMSYAPGCTSERSCVLLVLEARLPDQPEALAIMS